MAKLLDPAFTDLTALETELLSQHSVLIARQSEFPFLKSLATKILDKNLLGLFTSGSQQRKLIALSKNAMFRSAEEVNKWLAISGSDIWGIALPLYHVGSLSIFYRCNLAGCLYRHFPGKWNAENFSAFIEHNRITILSLVPTQLYDLVDRNISAPPALRIVLAGGDRLNPSLYIKARKLGWPVLPTYGMTECCSQIACASRESLSQPERYPDLSILPHLEVRATADHRLRIFGSSLLTFSAVLSPDGKSEITEYPANQGFLSKDLGQTGPDRILEIYGRADRQVKIRGHLIQPERYEELTSELLDLQNLRGQCAAVSTEDARDGQSIILFYSTDHDSAAVKLALQEYLKENLGKFPLPGSIYWLQRLPFLANGKIDYSGLANLARH